VPRPAVHHADVRPVPLPDRVFRQVQYALPAVARAALRHAARRAQRPPRASRPSETALLSWPTDGRAPPPTQCCVTVPPMARVSDVAGRLPELLPALASAKVTRHLTNQLKC